MTSFGSTLGSIARRARWFVLGVVVIVILGFVGFYTFAYLAFCCSKTGRFEVALKSSAFEDREEAVTFVGKMMFDFSGDEWTRWIIPADGRNGPGTGSAFMGDYVRGTSLGSGFPLLIDVNPDNTVVVSYGDRSDPTDDAEGAYVYTYVYANAPEGVEFRVLGEIAPGVAALLDGTVERPHSPACESVNSGRACN